jgi:hypothetical protein
MLQSNGNDTMADPQRRSTPPLSIVPVGTEPELNNYGFYSGPKSTMETLHGDHSTLNSRIDSTNSQHSQSFHPPPQNTNHLSEANQANSHSSYSGHGADVQLTNILLFMWHT